MIRVAFDVDGTLIHIEGFGIENVDTPRYEVIMMLWYFQAIDDVELYVWSGGGIDYTKAWVNKLGLSNFVTVIEKGGLVNNEKMDIVFDDEDVNLGKVNIRI